MRTREEIHDDIHSRLLQGQDGPAVRQSAMIEIGLDCRELLQKLVERRERTKTITAEVPFTEHENKVLDSIEA